MLDKLIEEGEALKKQIQTSSTGFDMIYGEDYEKWIAKCILYLQQNYKDHPITARFLKAAEEAKAQVVDPYYQMLGIMKALKEMDFSSRA